MKTTFNNFILRVILISSPAVFLATIIFLVYFFKKPPAGTLMENLILGEVSVDTISDIKGLGYTGQRKIVLDGKGNVYVAYRKDFNKHSEIFTARVFRENQETKVSGTEKPVAVIGKNNDQRVPSVAVDSLGDVHLTWYGSDIEKENNNRQIKYVRSADQGESWFSWRNISFVSGYFNRTEYWQEHPMITAGKDGVLYIVWEGKDENHPKQQVKFSKSTDSGNRWSYWKNVNSTENFTQSRPVLVENSQGKIFVFAYSSQKEGQENSLQQIQYTTSSDQGETWSAWQPLSDSSFDSRHVSAAPDHKGNIHLVWRQGEAGFPSKIVYAHLDPEGKLSRPIPVASSSRYQFFPSVGILPDNRLVTAWIETEDPSDFPQEDPSSGSIRGSLLESGKFQDSKEISGSSGGIYPNLPVFFGDARQILVVYEEPNGEGNFLIKVKNISLLLGIKP